MCTIVQHAFNCLQQQFAFWLHTIPSMHMIPSRSPDFILALMCYTAGLWSWCSILRQPLHCWCCSSQAQGKRVGQPCFADTAHIQQGPALTAAARRHPLTPSPMAQPGIRVVTYNILADQYASREYAQKVLFGYCPKR